MNDPLEYLLPDPDATEAFGARLAACASAGLLVYLHGELGSGKTTLVRGLLHALGHRGAVKSPTYTLVEPYEPGGRRVYHFDLYRLADPQELEYLGIRDYLTADALCLIEWPECGSGVLPAADLLVHLAYHPDGRRVRVEAVGPGGRRVVDCLGDAEG